MIKTTNPTTIMMANTGFVCQNPIRKGKIHTVYGFFLCTQFAIIVVGLLRCLLHIQNFSSFLANFFIELFVVFPTVGNSSNTWLLICRKYSITP